MCPSDYLRKMMGKFKSNKGKLSWAFRISLLVVHLFSPVPWWFQVFGCTVCLAMWKPNASSNLIAFLKRKQGHGCISLCPAVTCMGLQAALYYLWLMSWQANCTNAASVLYSARGLLSTRLCSVLADRAAGPSLGWPASQTNTLLFATDSAAELLNVNA